MCLCASGPSAAVWDGGRGRCTRLYAAGVVFVVWHCAVCASVSVGGAVMGDAGCAVPVCARTTGGWTWVATRSVAVSPVWCLEYPRFGEWLCAVCAHRRLALSELLCAHGVRAIVALLPLCAMGAGVGGRRTRLCAAGGGVFCVCCVVLCCTVWCVCPSRVEGRSWASWGVLCLCVRARQVSAIEQQPDQWQFPQRGVRPFVAWVSGCVLCLFTAGCH